MTTPAHLSIVVAVARNGVIGRGGKLPWSLPADLQHFKAVTMGKPIIMGRRTWESIGRPLPGRLNIVVTSRADLPAPTASSLAGALELAGGVEEACVIGGERLFREALPIADRLFFTRVESEVDGEVRFPEINWAAWQEVESRTREPDERNPHRLTFQKFERKLSPPVKIGKGDIG